MAVSFEQQLDPVSWTEVLNLGSYVAFDIVAAERVEVYFTESGADPGAVTGTYIYSHPASWDYEGFGFEVAEQRIWLRGNTMIRGVRA